MGRGIIFFSLLLALFFVCDSRIIGRKLKNGEPCDTPGFFGDAEDCRKFYRCAEHPTEDENNPYLIKYTFRCPNGTVFDEPLSTCNHPQAVPNLPQNCQPYDPEEPEQGSEGDGSSDGSSSSGGLFSPILISRTVQHPQTILSPYLNHLNPLGYPQLQLPIQHGNLLYYGRR